MIFDRNALWMGLLMGLCIPFVSYALLLSLYEQMEVWGWVSDKGFPPNFRQRTLTLLALCVNVFPLNYYYKRRHTRSMRGISLITLIYAISWIAYFWEDILN